MKQIIILTVALLGYSQLSFGQKAGDSPYYIDNDSILMTVVLKHQQESPVDSIQGRVMKRHFYGMLTDSHAKVVSWNVVMGIGQIMVLKFKPQYLREINNVFEKGAWGGFNTEFYPTYDFMPIYPKMLEKER